MADDIKVEFRKTDLVKRNPYAVRRHPRRQIEQIAASIKEFGWTQPIIVDEEDVVLAGHARLEAAIRLGLEEVPAIALCGLNPHRKRAYVIADNRLYHGGQFDDGLLSNVLADLRGVTIDAIGFTEDEIERALAETPTLREQRVDTKPITMTHVLISVPVATKSQVERLLNELVAIPGVEVEYGGN